MDVSLSSHTEQVEHRKLSRSRSKLLEGKGLSYRMKREIWDRSISRLESDVGSGGI